MNTAIVFMPRIRVVSIHARIVLDSRWAVGYNDSRAPRPTTSSGTMYVCAYRHIHAHILSPSLLLIHTHTSENESMYMYMYMYMSGATSDAKASSCARERMDRCSTDD